MMEAGCIPGNLGAFKKECGKIKLYGEQPSAPTSTTSTQLTYPKELQGDVINMAKKAIAASNQGYIPYEGNRIAGLDPFQLTAQQGVANLQPSQQLGAATQFAGEAGMKAGDINYIPSGFGNQYNAPANYQSGSFNPQNVSAPNLQQYQMANVQDVNAPTTQAALMAAAQTKYNPNLQQYQMGPADQVSTSSFVRPGTAQEYMSPYQQAVTDIQKREAIRQSDIMKQGQNAQAVQAGAFGGSRQAIVEAERQRNLGTQLGDIQAQGSQSAFNQAQQQFNAEQQARMQAAMANQQAGLTVGQQNLASRLGVQQLGAQTGLQTALANLSSEQQANVQNQAAQMQAQGLNAQQAMQAALANQQAGLTVGQQNLQAQLGVQQLGAGQNLQAQLANQSAAQQAQQMQEASRQFGYGQQMNAAQLAAQYGLSGQQATEASRQFGANLGLQGLQTALTSANALGNLGNTQYQQNMGINQMQNQYGLQQQGQEQNILNNQYQDFLNYQNSPYKQMGFMSDILRGLPLTQQSSSM
jgi:hypothetical protein